MVRGLQSLRLSSASMISWAVKLDLSPFCQKTRITSHSASEMFGSALIDYVRNLSGGSYPVKHKNFDLKSSPIGRGDQDGLDQQQNHGVAVFLQVVLAIQDHGKGAL